MGDSGEHHEQDHEQDQPWCRLSLCCHDLRDVLKTLMSTELQQQLEHLQDLKKSFGGVFGVAGACSDAVLKCDREPFRFEVHLWKDPPAEDEDWEDIEPVIEEYTYGWMDLHMSKCMLVNSDAVVWNIDHVEIQVNAQQLNIDDVQVTICRNGCDAYEPYIFPSITVNDRQLADHGPTRGTLRDGDKINVEIRSTPPTYCRYCLETDSIFPLTVKRI